MNEVFVWTCGGPEPQMYVLVSIDIRN
jgi:hypothetical protein